MANSLDWNVYYHGKGFLSYFLAVSYGSMNAWLVTRGTCILKANNEVTQLSQRGKTNVKN